MARNSSLLVIVLFVHLVSLRASGAPSLEEIRYPPVDESDGRTPLYFSLIQSFSGQYISAYSLVGLELALDLINKDPVLLPGYSLHYVFTDAPVRFTDSDKARLLSVSAFDCYGNSLCNHFQSCKDGYGFVSAWKVHIQPHLNKYTGVFQSPTTDSNALPTSKDTSVPSDSTSVSEKCKKRKVSSLSPPALTPASKMARIAQDSQGLNEEEMDCKIQQLFLGFFTLPVTSLFEPPTELLVRDKSEKFIESLKREMLDNPTANVQPMLCIVSLESGQQFSANIKEAFKYHTIGGNNSREALQQLLNEHSELKKEKVFTHRLCSVYSPMDTTLALRLASKHNRATAFIHEMTTWDKVMQCRKLLYNMAHMLYSEDECPSEKPNGWKDVCAAVLTQKKQQLDDGLIYYLASLPCNTFRAITTIFQKFSKGLLKGQKVPRAKKGVQSKPLDLKGSNFRCLRGVSELTVHKLLLEVSEEKLSLQEIAVQCADAKVLSKIQLGFIKATNCASWEDALQKFPMFTTAEKLEPFKCLDFSSSTLPEQFMMFCRSALNYSPEEDNDAVAVNLKEDDNLFVIEHQSSIGLFWKTDVFTVNSDNMNRIFEKTMRLCDSSLHFSGYALYIFDIPDGQTSEHWNTRCWSSAEAKKLCLLARALNFSVSASRQKYNVIFITPLDALSDISRALADDFVQTGVCSFEPGRPPPSKSLRNEANGLVFVRCGGEELLNDSSSNTFIYECDPPCLDKGTNKPINSRQRPVAFLERLIDLFTSPGDWILDGLSGTGSTLIAALRMQRNCLCIDQDGIQFVLSKIRCVTELQPEKSSDDTPSDTTESLDSSTAEK